MKVTIAWLDDREPEDVLVEVDIDLPGVPRVGESVELSSVERLPDVEEPVFRVTAVVWKIGDAPWVNVVFDEILN